MTRISAFEHDSSVDQLAPQSLHGGNTTAQNIVISPAGLTEIPVPGQGFITNAVMSQEGSDLILETPDGITIVIEGYFSADTAPDLISPDGKVLTPTLVKSFIQASTEYAEETTAMNDATPVGEVHEVTGNATVTHPDGTKEAAVKGTHIFEGDVVETDAQGAVNIKFADESSFAISNNAKMAIDEFVFDSTTNGGENNFSVLRGLFVYTSGLVGREDPDDVKINTPVGSIGIRGTIITGVLPPEGSDQPAQISVVEGAIVITGTNGKEVTLSQQFETVQIGANGEMTNIGEVPQGDIIQTFNVLRTVSPTLFSTIEETGQDTPQTDETPVEGEVPATEDAAPTEEQPAQESAPAEQAPAEPAPDVIELNLLEDRLDTINLDADGALQQDGQKSLTSTVSLATAATIIVAAAPAEAAPPPVAETAAQTDSSNATTPNVEVLDPRQDPPAAVNAAPTALLAAYTAFEQKGYAGGTHTFDISRFFRDADGDALTYTTNILTGSLTGVTVNASGLLTYSVNGTLAGATEIATFTVYADDGEDQSSLVTFTVDLVQTTNDYGAGDDSETITMSGGIYNLGGGNDDVLVSANNNGIFAGEGGDFVNISSGISYTHVYAEGGMDTILVNGGVNNTISGGGGNDTISLFMTSGGETYRVFGGTDNDTIILNSSAVTGLSGGLSLIDGGEGFDTLSIGNGTSLNLLTVPATALLGIEKIRMESTGSATLTLDLADVFSAGRSGQSFYLDVDGNDIVVVSNSHGFTSLTQRAGTATDVDGETYNIFSNGDMTLYLSTDATMGNVTGLV